MTTFVIISGFLLMTSLIIFLFIKYKAENKKYNDLFLKTNKYLDELKKPLKLGYYKMKCQQGEHIDYDVIVYVNEIDRYTNGESKIKLYDIDIDCCTGSLDKISAESFIKKFFVSLKKTDEIIWLDSETEIKEQRRNKLEHLKEAINN